MKRPVFLILFSVLLITSLCLAKTQPKQVSAQSAIKPVDTQTTQSSVVNFIPIIVIIAIVWGVSRYKKQKCVTNIAAPGNRKIRETKCTCQACGNVWYYGKQEAWENKAKNMENCGNSMSNTGSDMMCCGGCAPAVFIPQKQATQVKDLSKCPKCNSSAIRKEEVVHEV